MNKLEMYKRFLKDIRDLKVSESQRGNFISIYARLVNQLNNDNELIKELKELLLPVFENKIRGLEEEIKSK